MPVMISVGSMEVVKGPVTRLAAGITRRPVELVTVISAFSAMATEAQSPCGSAWASDPPKVPRLRTSGSLMSGAASWTTP
jgi:hypothetical protein